MHPHPESAHATRATSMAQIESTAAAAAAATDAYGFIEAKLLKLMSINMSDQSFVVATHHHHQASFCIRSAAAAF